MTSKKTAAEIGSVSRLFLGGEFYFQLKVKIP